MEKKKYTPGKEVLEAEKALQAHKGRKPGGYHSQWKDQADALLGQIQYRKPFSYDAARDPMYRQAVDHYVRMGRQAMMDSAGQAAALTGGYGNSYGQTVSQQTYEGYLEALAGKLPEFQKMALEAHNAGGRDLKDRYELLNQREKEAYGQYQKVLQEYYVQQDRLQAAYDRTYDRDYNRYVGDRDFEYGAAKNEQEAAARAEQARAEQARWEADRKYQQERDRIRDAQWQQEYEEDKRRYEQQWAEQHSGGTGGGGGSGGGSRGGGNLRKYQGQHGMTESEFEKRRKHAQQVGHHGSRIPGGEWYPRGNAYSRPTYQVTIR